MIMAPVTAILGLAIAIAVRVTAIDIDTSGFLSPRLSYSVGGHAVCVNGIVPVHVSGASNVQLNLPSSTNRTEATQLLLDLFTVNSTIVAQVSGPERQISQQFNISSRLCYPRQNATGDEYSTVQFLTHGIGFGQNYWDFAAPSNSYIDSAAQAGQVTFSYDRLGVGESSHPDPIQIVQGPAQVSIAHALVGLLRDGELSATNFSRVIGVGHSYGSAITTTVAATYPLDFDALVLTGFGDNATGAPQFWAAQNLVPASTDLSQRFVGLEDGYLVASTIYGVQYAFFHFPGFEIPILYLAFANRQTTTWGEQFTMETLEHPAESYRGPVFVVNGVHDLVFCQGNCNFPSNVALRTLRNVFPAADAARSGAFLLPNSGHGLNLHANAPLAFERIQSFILDLDLD
ncbi:hypothetical protein CNMCM5793_004150 [Aspergillus hiratsukae]|uniref:AB hydrolase-1 domain-containing protein n=1 Tax=Aspergillus hiratsukae TaxID=1194566 RepID=A0A8H6PS45_9EURO|nr:hypothetical protein CNMCM5793_004150 [Aspergillus hiratsukae]KAF7159109.1 hypothetical protein CNMCM6106_006194 [Aspergillus hiratsukae]